MSGLTESETLKSVALTITIMGVAPRRRRARGPSCPAGTVRAANRDTLWALPLNEQLPAIRLVPERRRVSEEFRHDVRGLPVVKDTIINLIPKSSGK